MNICVYGASSTEIDKKYIEAGEALGRLMADRGHSLVFGGGANGMMGAVARGVHEGGGFIIGVAPSFFNVDGILYDKCTQFIYPDTMRERKRIMDESSAAFIASPGGLGTFDEFFEIVTLKQLGRHSKPIALLSTDGYYDHFEAFIQNGIDQKFMNPECRELFYISDDPVKILDYIENYDPADAPVSKFKSV